MTSDLKIIAGRFLLVFLWALVWEWTARTGALPPAFIGQPSIFLTKFFEHLVDGSFISASLITLEAVVVAFTVGALLALLTALVMTVFPILEKLFSPIIDALNALPRVALIPLFILWLSVSYLSVINSDGSPHKANPVFIAVVLPTPEIPCKCKVTAFIGVNATRGEPKDVPTTN